MNPIDPSTLINAAGGPARRLKRWNWRVGPLAPVPGSVVLVAPDVLDEAEDGEGAASGACATMLSSPRTTFIVPTRHPARFNEALGSAIDPHPLARNIVPALYVERQGDLSTHLLDQLGAVGGAARRALVLSPLEEIDLFRVDSTGRDTDRNWIAYTNAVLGLSYAGSYTTDDPAAYTRRPAVDLLVVAGDEGAAAPPMHPAWVRLVRSQARGAAVPFVLAGWGAWVPDTDRPEAVLRALADEGAGARMERGVLCSVCGAYMVGGEGALNHKHAWRFTGEQQRWVYRAGALAGASLDGCEHVDLPAWL